jgi:hypothetical protein
MSYRSSSLIGIKAQDGVCAKAGESGSKYGGCPGYSGSTDIITLDREGKPHIREKDSPK